MSARVAAPIAITELVLMRVCGVRPLLEGNIPSAHPTAWTARIPMSTPMLLASAATMHPTRAIARDRT